MREKGSCGLHKSPRLTGLETVYQYGPIPSDNLKLSDNSNGTSGFESRPVAAYMVLVRKENCPGKQINSKSLLDYLYFLETLKCYVFNY